ncbi:hypothetical protein cyc_01945 [Cyclospora cayetanensis]|uniref:Uncharacterized protein n=1 Tax=Cyclospora cayetanensis TaxID=88456 RepID=A0A1D3CVQ5_9EIME|nr:hypothetical protein cyc_01945 [Cyclospora cayetanensis]
MTIANKLLLQQDCVRVANMETLLQARPRAQASFRSISERYRREREGSALKGNRQTGSLSVGRQSLAGSGDSATPIVATAAAPSKPPDF